ncbi:MAG: DUF72 domain-containing protein [Ignavibacteriaceae bacterium]|nr:DUF72 domain-containing protein [Ignavibacteriaceae bacterium]
MQNVIPAFHIGTAGWSYKDWVPNFYPKQQSNNFDWLQFYAENFNCVEVNSTYYTYLSPKIVEGWIRKVEDADDFLFTIKLHQDFTHNRKYDKQSIKSVSENLNKLVQAERLGGILIQFPYSFSFNDSSAEYIRQLNEVFSSYNQFVEVRHSSWSNKSAYDFFKALNISFCTIDQPEIGKAISFEPVVTNETAYLRFHGRNVDAWKKSLTNFGKEQSYEQQSERYNYCYSPGELAEVIQKVKAIYCKVKEMYIIMNNHPQGNAVVNANEFMNMLGITVQKMKSSLF